MVYLTKRLPDIFLGLSGEHVVKIFKLGLCGDLMGEVGGSFVNSVPL